VSTVRPAHATRWGGTAVVPSPHGVTASTRNGWAPLHIRVCGPGPAGGRGQREGGASGRAGPGGTSMEIEIGKGKMARRAYRVAEVALVPGRRTRDPDDVDISWQIDAYTFGLPMMASAMDAGVSPATAVRIGRLGGLACLNLEGLWTRYEDPEPVYEEIGTLPDEKATGRMQELYREPLKDELVERRIREIKEAG